MANEIKEILEMLQKYGSTNDKVLLNYITNLQEENERLRKDYSTLMQDNSYTLELEQRIDKAVEYIKHEWFKREQIGIAPLQFSYEELQNVLNILRGDE